LYYLVYASNLTAERVEFELKSNLKMETITDLRKMVEIREKNLKLGPPYQETIFRIEKAIGKNK